ncbi:hypothetical protein C8R43DRAFT_987856, partial [Mycena crocata]
MVAIRPRFPVFLCLCLAASSSATSFTAAPAAHDMNVGRSDPNVNLPARAARITHVGHNTLKLPKPIPLPSKMVKRAGPPSTSSTPKTDGKLPAPAPAMPEPSASTLPELPIPKSNTPASVPEPFKLPKTDKRSVSTAPELPPKSPKHNEPAAVPNLPVPAPNPAAIPPRPRRSDHGNTLEPMEHPPIVRPHFSSRDMTGGKKSEDEKFADAMHEHKEEVRGVVPSADCQSEADSKHTVNDAVISASASTLYHSDKKTDRRASDEERKNHHHHHHDQPHPHDEPHPAHSHSHSHKHEHLHLSHS